MCPLNITLLHKFLYGFTKRSTKYMFLQNKSNTKKDGNMYFGSDLSQI